MASPSLCAHLSSLGELLQDEQYICPECVAQGDQLHLRVCQTCGHVGCCDNSKNKHAPRHFHATSHPVIASAEPGERWAWCYVDSAFAEY